MWMKEGKREDEVDGAAQGKPPKTCHLLQEISPLGVICLEPNVAYGASGGTLLHVGHLFCGHSLNSCSQRKRKDEKSIARSTITLEVYLLVMGGRLCISSAVAS